MAEIEHSERVTAAGTPLLGRHREREALRAALTDARAGRGRAVLLAGEAGIGKTTLMDHLAEEARLAGAPAIWGRAWEAGGAPGFWPWTQVARGILQDGDAAALRRRLGPATAWLAQIVPELAGGEQPSAIAREGEQARLELFLAMESLLRLASSAGPLVVLLEDLHAADVGSLRLLEFLVRPLSDAPVLLAGSYRALEARARRDAAAALARVAEAGTAIELGGLEPPDVGRLVSARTGEELGTDTVTALHAFTEGNPLYADEISRVLMAEGGVERIATAAITLPHGVGETIRRRLGPLTGESTQALVKAAVIGREFRLRTLERVVDDERDALLAQLDAAIAAGVVVPDREEVGRYRFAHALFREALYDHLPDSERARVHGDVAEALEAIYGDAVERQLAELAHHYLAAAPQAGVEKAIEYATRAGHRAMAMFAFEEAGDHFHGALGALGLLAVDDERRGALLLALGNARMRAGDTQGARAALLEAAELARATGDAEQLARAALALGVWGITPTTDDELVALLEEATAALGSDNPALRARLLARLASALTWSPDHERRRAAAVEALALSRDHGGPRTRGHVLIHATTGLIAPDTVDERLANAAELEELARRTGDLEWALNVVLQRIPAYLELGNGPRVLAAIDELERLVGRMNQPRVQFLVPSHRALLAAMEGRWDDYESLAGRALAIGASVPGTVAPLVHRAQLLGVRWSQGRVAELEEALGEAAALFPGLPAWRCALALAYAEAGREARARSTFGLLATDDFAAIPHDHTRLVSLGFLADAATALDDPTHAGALHALLAPYAGRHLATAQGTYCGPVQRHLGQLAALEGDLEAALDHLAAARGQAERMNAPVHMPRIALDEGIALLRAGQPDRAIQRLARAERLAEELAMPHVAARARERAEQAGVAARPGRAGAAAAGAAEAGAEATSGLLRREGDVWAFVFGGRTVRLKDAKGLRHLAVLLANPGDEVHALDLVGGGGARTAGGAAAADAGLHAGGSSAGPVLDPQAKREYRQRIAELQEEIEEAESFNDPERAARLRHELAFLGEELAGAVGLGGRDRQTGSDAERARVNATRAIRTTIKRLGELDEELGLEFEATVRTGTYCCFEPDPRRPVTWRVEG